MMSSTGIQLSSEQYEVIWDWARQPPSYLYVIALIFVLNIFITLMLHYWVNEPFRNGGGKSDA